MKVTVGGKLVTDQWSVTSGAATGKARSPTVERRDDRTSVYVDDQRKRRRASKSETYSKSRD